MKTWHIAFLLAASLLSPPSPAADETGKTASGVRYDGGDEILLQGFHWNAIRTKPGGWYTELKNRSAQIASDGFTAIWMPPPWCDSSSWSHPDGTSGGGEGYFWKDFDKNGNYGSDADLRAAAAALNAAHVKPIYDIVANHRDQKGEGSTLRILPWMGRMRADCLDINDSADCDDGDPFGNGDADFDLKSNANIQMFVAELKALHDTYGARGFRFDFVRGYAARHVDEFMKGGDDGGFCVGEWWKGPGDFPAGDPNRNKSWQELLKEWSDGAKCTVFDFALKERMQNGGSVTEWRHGLNGNPVQGWREVAVTFVDNHDTGWSPGANGGQHHWALCPSSSACPKLRMAYAFILTTPGTPTVYWPDMYADDGKPTELHDYLKRLIAIRREAGVRAGSQVSFYPAYNGLVVDVTGKNQRLIVALDTSLKEPRALLDTDFVPALEDDGGKVRVWHTGKVAPVSVTFRCRNGNTTPGRSVYVVGDSKELGMWNLADAVKLDPAAYPTWSGKVMMAPAFETGWKCVIRNEVDNGKLADTAQWESDPDNKVTPAAGIETEGSF